MSASAPLPKPESRRPLRYKRPRTSWVTVVILGFAAVGMAAVGGTTLKRLMGQTTTPAQQAEKAIRYSALSKDDAVLVSVQGVPRDARLTLDGEPAVSNPLRILRSKDHHRVAVLAPGFEPAAQDFTADVPKTIRFHLRRAP